MLKNLKNLKTNEMEKKELNALIKELCDTKVKRISYDGSVDNYDLISREGRNVLELVIKKHLLDNRDEKIGILKAKVYTYEQIISKSNFAPLLPNKIEEFKKLKNA